MKIFKSPQRVLILFLSVLIVTSFIMIVRLEGKASSLQSSLDEHHKSLKQNEDVLSNLKVFQRMVQANGIYLDNKLVGFFAGNSRLDMTNDKVILSSDDIEIGPSSEKNMGYNKSDDTIYMLHKGARIILGQITTLSSGKKPGIQMVSKDNGPNLAVLENGIVLTVPDKQGDYKISMAPFKDYLKISKDESVIKLEKENIGIEAKGDIEIGPSSEKNMGYNKSDDTIYMLHKGARIILGQITTLSSGKKPGIQMVSKDNGPNLAVLENGIVLTVPDKQGDYKISMAPFKDYLKISKDESVIKLEKENISIEAKGDINITSKNGNVNINGKKVNLNE